MPILTLRDAAEYVRTSKASKLLLTALKAVNRIFTFTDERANRVTRYVAILDSYQKGTPIQEILDKYGCSKRTLYDYINKAEITPRRFIPANIKENIIRDYKNEIPTSKIAGLNNVSLRYVMKVVSDAGLSRKKKK